LPKSNSIKPPELKSSPKVSGRETLSRLIKEASFGWLGTAQDLALVALYASAKLHRGAFVPISTDKVMKDAAKLFTNLQDRRVQKSLRKSLYSLADDGFRRGSEITNRGFARLKHIIPKYIDQRPWNGWLYLTIYDIPENIKRSRDKFRNLMKQLSFGMLQESVWASFTDPEPFLADLIEWDQLEDFVITVKSRVSPRLRKGLIPLLAKAFKLDNLNLRYEAFINRVKEAKSAPPDLAIKYLAILKDDPQLPFRLLPRNWLGDKAYQVYVKKILPKMPHEYGQFISKLDKIV